MRDAPPWARPAGGYADGGGVKSHRRLANHWKRWDAKFWRLWHPNGGASPPMLCQSDCGSANHGKPWDAKLWGLRSKFALMGPRPNPAVRRHSRPGLERVT